MDTPTLACSTLRTSSAPESKSEFVGAQPSLSTEWPGGSSETPSSGLFVGRHGFCSSCFSLIVKFSFALNSLPLFSSPPPPLFFGQRQKKVEQRRPSFKPNHSPTLGRMNCLLYISPVFSWNSGIPVSHTQLSM